MYKKKIKKLKKDCKKKKEKKVIGKRFHRKLIDHNSPECCAFYLLAIAKDLCSELELNFNLIHAEMTATDYPNLIKVFEKHFEDFVIIYEG